MRKILLLIFSYFISFVSPSYSQITCDTNGNVVLYSNYDGGILNINVDVNIPNLKIGIVSYEMVTINLSGPFVNNITEVQFAGYTTTTHHHCANSPAVTSIVGAPPGTDTLVFMPNSPIPNSNGYYIIICNYSCDTTSNQGGCNTPDQVAAYFQQEFGGLLRYHFTQYGCWNGTYNISDGGNCCISTIVPSPQALFTSSNHICPGTCINFTNLSSNASTYEWTFAGGNPSTSTDINPAGICYSTPGNYAVSLIATGAGGSDTVSLNNYITVYPFPAPQGIQQVGDTLFANQGATSYQWYYNGNIINGATDYFYIASQSGDYNVVATDENDCEVEAVINNVIAGLTPALSNGEGVVVFPNPVSESLSVTGYSSAFMTNGSAGLSGTTEVISVYNILGEMVLAVPPDSYREQTANCKLPTCLLDVSSLHTGAYIIEITTQEGKSRGRFIKQ